MMKQIQLRNINKESDNYNKIVCKGLINATGEYLYLLDSVEKMAIFDMNIKDLNSRFVELEETHDLTEIELELLGEFTNILSTLKYYNIISDEFEAEGRRLAKNESKLSLLDLVYCYKELDECKNVYLNALTMITDLNKQLEDLQKRYSTFLSNTTDESAVDLLDLILTNTSAYLDKDQLKLTLTGHAPLADLSKVLAFNGVHFNKESLFGLGVDIKGMPSDVDFTLTFSCNLLEPLTYVLATKIIKEFKATYDFLISLNNGHSGQDDIESDVESE